MSIATPSRVAADSRADVSLLSDRIAAVDWRAIETVLCAHGFAALPRLLTTDECNQLAALYEDDSLFRSRIDMERFRFGVGEYKYFAAPLPPVVQTLRTELYPRLVPTANRWADELGISRRYPDTLDRFSRRCHEAGQTRPTPLLLTYTTGGYNCLHQDIYGAVAFPLQVVLVLSRKDMD
jgi:uncharacterized protein